MSYVLAAFLAAVVLVHPCQTRQLHVWLDRTGAALGTVGGYVAFTNRGPTCTLRGWPSLTALSPVAAATAVHTRTTMLGPYEVRGTPLVTLRRGQTAVAGFATTDIPPNGYRCPPSFRQLRITPPGNTESVLVRAWIVGLGRELPNCGQIEVTMVVPARDLPPRG
jgi:uncharacterized protein DUF4232